MMMSKTFEVKPEHIKLLQRAYIDWQDCETGAPAIDPKRPYGNSYVVGDIFEILEWKHPEEDDDLDEEFEDLEDKAMTLHQETQTVLQILVSNISVGISPGKYRQVEEYSNEWVRVK